MANTIPSANMSLPVPIVGQDPGPQYGTDVNNCLTIIDSHNHSAGYGVQITPSGLNINADLSINDNNITLARSLRFQAQTSAISGASDIGCLYEAGVDLYYNDGSGNQIRITQSGSVAGASGTITGLPSGTASAAYSGGTFVFQSATNTAANIDGASFILRNNTANSHGLTLQAPNSLGSNYSITLPAIPSQTNVMTLDTSGNMGSITYDAVGENMTSTGANAIAASITRPVSVPTGGIGNVVIGNVVNQSVSATSPTLITGSDTTLQTSGNPVVIIVGGNGGSGPGSFTLHDTSGTSNQSTIAIWINNVGPYASYVAAPPASSSMIIPSSSASFVIPLSAGDYKFQLYTNVSAAGSIVTTGVQLIAYELH